MRGYQATIVSITGCTPDEARRAEAFMRVQYSTLDHLDINTFHDEAVLSLACARQDPELGDALARSEGL